MDAEHVLISAGHKNKQFHHPRESALLAYQEHGAEEFYSTSADGRNHLTVTIGPARNQFAVTGASSGFTYWTDVDETGSCSGEEHGGFCLETWE